MDPSITTLTASVVGVLVGACSSLTTQRLSLNATVRQRGAERRQQLRDERKATIVDFLDAVQLAERLVDRRWRTGALPEGAGDAIHRLWLQQKVLEIIGGRALRDASLAFAQRLSDGLFGEEKRDYALLADFLREPRDLFLDAARRELDLPDHA